MLKEKEFDTKQDLIEWANSEDGTDYIISVIFADNKWTLFYIDQI